MSDRMNVDPLANGAGGRAVAQSSTSMANRGGSSAPQTAALPAVDRPHSQPPQAAQAGSKPYWHDGVIAEFARAVSSTAPGRDVLIPLRNFTIAAKALQDALATGAEWHCFATLTDPETLAAFPLFTRLWNAALDSRRKGAKFARDAFCDAVLVAQGVSKEPITQYRIANALTRPILPAGVMDDHAQKRRKITEVPVPVNMVLPAWFPYDVDSIPQLPTLPPNGSRVPKTVHIDEPTFAHIHRLNSQELANVYSTFFRGLWARECQLCKSDAAFRHKISGSIVYLKLTPEWLREEVTFVRGNNLDFGFPFTMRELPIKNVIRARDNKRIGCAILTEWLTRREACCDYLLALLASRGMRINPSDIPRKSNGLSRAQSAPQSASQTQRTGDSSQGNSQRNFQCSPNQNHSLIHAATGFAQQASDVHGNDLQLRSQAQMDTEMADEAFH